MGAMYIYKLVEMRPICYMQATCSARVWLGQQTPCSSCLLSSSVNKCLKTCPQPETSLINNPKRPRRIHQERIVYYSLWSSCIRSGLGMEPEGASYQTLHLGNSRGYDGVISSERPSLWMLNQKPHILVEKGKPS